MSVAIRLLNSAFWILTSAYCVIAYLPFTYGQVIRTDLFGWLTVFTHLHPYLYLGMGLAVSATLKKELFDPKSKYLTRSFFALYFAAGVFLLFQPWLTDLRDDATSLLSSFLALVPLYGLAVIDAVTIGSRKSWRLSNPSAHSSISSLVFFAGLASSTMVVFFYSGGAWFRGGFLGWEYALSLIHHLLIFSILGVVLNLGRMLSRAVADSKVLEGSLVAAIASFILAFFLRKVLLPTISFTGLWGNIYIALFSLAIFASLFSLGLRYFGEHPEKIHSGLDVLVGPLAFGFPRNTLFYPVWLAGIAWFSYFSLNRLAVFDWNFLMQQLSVVVVWILSFVFCYAVFRKVKLWGPDFLLPAGATLFLFLYLGSMTAFAGVPGAAAALEKYAKLDMSFRLVRQLVSAPPPAEDSDFYRFVQGANNIPATAAVAPVPIELARNLASSSREKPNLIVLVIDSLRKDYLGAYNSKVTFTPNLDRFAQEGIVFENAFTHYGGTALAEPSIWVGGMILPKQYVTPFYPMNSLEKLIETEGYHSLISMDSILNVIVKRSPDTEELDKGVTTQDLEICRSFNEAKAKMEGEKSGVPLFLYTQPQNIHVSVIHRAGESVPDGETYPGFYAPYASRLRQVDRCFGDFVEYLKRRGIYDHSIIVFTSDHGDSLGEDGRFGHAYTIYPEIIRIPLFMHLPPGLAKEMTWDTRSLAFSTDITPSLYYLLGRHPVDGNEVLGRSLFVTRSESLTHPTQTSFYVASSYGPVVGILQDEGSRLYIADAIGLRDSLYELGRGTDASYRELSLSPDQRATYRSLIRDQVASINRFYRFEGVHR